MVITRPLQEATRFNIIQSIYLENSLLYLTEESHYGIFPYFIFVTNSQDYQDYQLHHRKTAIKTTITTTISTTTTTTERQTITQCSANIFFFSNFSVTLHSCELQGKGLQQKKCHSHLFIGLVLENCSLLILSTTVHRYNLNCVAIVFFLLLNIA